jgi:hypothetical protein
MMKIEEICTSNSANVAIIVVFVISFLVFRYIASRKERPHEQNVERMKQAEEYLNRHLMDSEDFFLN